MFAKTTTFKTGDKLKFGISSMIVLFAVHLLAQFVQGQEAEAPKDGPPYKTVSILPQYDVPDTPDNFESMSSTMKREFRAELKVVTDQLKNDRKGVMDGLVGKASLNQDQINTYTRRFIFASMTQTDDETLSKLGEMRESFLDDYLSAKVTPANRGYVIRDLTIPAMKAIAEGNYHPAVRLNAVLLVGMINATEPSKDTLPRPSNDAVQFLVGVMNNQALPEYVKVGAISGLHRNMMIDAVRNSPQIDGGLRTQIGNISQAIAGKTAPGQDTWDEDSGYWLRRRAVQIIGFMKDANAAQPVVDILANEDERIWLRFDAMMALKEIPVTSAAADKAAESIIRYIAGSLKEEAVHLETQLTELVAINLLYGDQDLLKVGTSKKKDEFTRGEGMGLGGSFGGEDEDEDTGPKIDLPAYQLNLVRRRVQATTSSAKDVLEKLKSRVSSDFSPKVTEAANLMVDVIEEANVGLVDLGADEPEDDMLDDEEKGPEKAVADLMGESFTKLASNLEKLLTPEAAADPIGGAAEPEADDPLDDPIGQ